MSGWVLPCPEPPGWAVDWAAVEAEYGWLRALGECLQDPVHHPEGDVLVHTRLVGEALAARPAFRALAPAERRGLFAAALLHDVAKPACTRREGDRLTTRGHARRGAIMARAILWRLGAPFAEREAVCGLIRHHQAPFHLLDDPDWTRRLIGISYPARCDHLALLAEADARGRLSADWARLIEHAALFAEAARELGCLTAPYPFASDHARFEYFRTPGRDPAYAAHDATWGEVLLLSGLPGAGKDHWLRAHRPELPVVSLDAIRARLGVAPTDLQAPVIAAAREAAREHLRAERPFAWNGTNLSRQLRAECLDLFAAYGARVRIVYVEVPPERLFTQNRHRPQPVPEAAIERLLDRWEVPDLTEAHAVEHAVMAE